MAIFGVGKSKVSLKMVRNNGEKVYEVAAKETITLRREPNVASVLTTSIRRDEITVECGDFLQLVIDEGHFMFYGVVTETVKSDCWCDVTAQDQLYYMARMNSMFEIYENKTADEILKDIIIKKGLKAVDPPHIMQTGHVIEYLVEENAKPLDVILDAIDMTQEATGEVFYIWDDSGNICLHSEQWLAEHTRIIVSAEYIEKYAYTESIDNMVTRVQLYSDKNTTDGAAGERQFFIKEEPGLMERYGELGYDQSIQEVDDGNAKAQQILDAKKVVPAKMSIQGCQGDVRVKGGSPVFVDLFSKDNMEYIRGWFKTNSVTHEIKAGHHTMNLDLTLLEMYDNWNDREVGR